jgi:hypothetical protein
LQKDGRIPPSKTSDHVSRELRRFDLFMTDVRGLSASTRRLRLRLIGRFLRDQFGSQPVSRSADQAC